MKTFAFTRLSYTGKKKKNHEKEVDDGWRTRKQKAKTNNTRDSPVVTDLSTSLALHSLIRGERTGSHVFCELWSFVLIL